LPHAAGGIGPMAGPGAFLRLTVVSTLDLARTQFGVITLFHFIFVPISIGLAAWVAFCETMHYRTKREVYLRMTRFWGKLMLISFAIGVVTGIVQEFQFGMNWSQYSRYVGDIFGAPLAMEGLAAFFLESTFLGLWIFGWGRLSPRLHLMTAWAVSIGTLLSAYFILAANSWMQHPVGYAVNHATGRAELKNIFDVLGNSTVLWAFPHTILGAFTTGGMLVLAVCAWNLLRGRHVDLFSRSARLVLPITAVAAIGTAMVGHGQGVLMEKQQPMKMAAAEAIYHSQKGAGFSLFATGTFTRNPGKLSHDLRIPHALSILATASWNGKVDGINAVQAAERAKYGPGDYVPVVWVTYWSFRLMIGAGTLMILLSLAGLVLVRRKKLETSRWFLRLAMAGAALPILANWTGWIFTEMGRQPWVVYGLLRTSDANSPHVTTSLVLLSLIGFGLLYAVLAAVGGWIAVREIRKGPEDEGAAAPEDRELVMAY
jgi:cytochrome bd ubiquinol oxidase subunit I